MMRPKETGYRGYRIVTQVHPLNVDFVSGVFVGIATYWKDVYTGYDGQKHEIPERPADVFLSPVAARRDALERAQAEIDHTLDDPPAASEDNDDADGG